jgi:hypothetical protein
MRGLRKLAVCASLAEFTPERGHKLFLGRFVECAALVRV